MEDGLPDKSQALVLDALRQVMAEPAGMPLFAGKSQPGLFAGTGAGKQAAQFCQQEGYLTRLRTEPRGKSTVDVCVISEKGLAFLLSQVNPTPVLEAILHSLESRHGEFNDLLGSARASQRYLEELKETVHKALEHFRQASLERLQTCRGPSTNGKHEQASSQVNGCAPATVLLDSLRHWQASGSLGDCPLPRLYRTVEAVAAGLSIGQFHDCLRTLHSEQRIYLHPWTGPLYEIPEPGLALLVGHEVAYYVSLKK
jgi:hypothetical protein